MTPAQQDHENTQAQAADRALIIQTVAELEKSQNERNADDFLRLFTPGVVWVTAFGKRLTGLDEISEFTRKVLTPELGDQYARYEVVHVSFLREDVAVVNVHQRPVDGEGQPRDNEAEGSPVYVMVKEQGRWMIAAGQNTKIQGAAIEQQRREIEAR